MNRFSDRFGKLQCFDLAASCNWDGFFFFFLFFLSADSFSFALQGGLLGVAQCSKMDLLKNERACVSGCDFHKVHTLGVSKMFLSNS